MVIHESEGEREAGPHDPIGKITTSCSSTGWRQPCENDWTLGRDTWIWKGRTWASSAIVPEKKNCQKDQELVGMEKRNSLFPIPATDAVSYIVSFSQAVRIIASCEWAIREEYNTEQAQDSCLHTAYNLVSKQIPYSPAFSPFLPPWLVLPYLLSSGFWGSPDPSPYAAFLFYLHIYSSFSHPVSWS